MLRPWVRIPPGAPLCLSMGGDRCGLWTVQVGCGRLGSVSKLAVVLGFLWLGTGCGAGQVESDRAPNIVILVGDDQGLHLGAYGHSSVTTPHLDQLAAQGMRFDRAYAVTAVCTPSRAALYTGLFPPKNGCNGFRAIGDGVRIWSDYLGPAGYRTGMIGKLGGKPIERFHFDFMARSLPKNSGARSVVWFAEQLEAFLDSDDPRPFCLVVNLRDAHYPFPSDGAPTGQAASPELPHDPALVSVPAFLPDLAEVRGELARFQDAIRRLDATVGALLDVLDRDVPAEELLVIYTSDHGIPFPFAKTTLYEAGIRVPLIARWPGSISAGSQTLAMTNLADILPTCLDLAGSVVPALDGRSLIPVLRGDATEHREEIVAFHTSHRRKPDVPSRSLRVGDWKYIRNLRSEARFQNGVMATSATWAAMLARSATDEALAQRVMLMQFRPREELFDLSTDPAELHNLAADKQHSAKLEQLRERLRAFLEDQEDELLGEF